MSNKTFWGGWIYMESFLVWLKENWVYIFGSGGVFGVIQFVCSFFSKSKIENKSSKNKAVNQTIYSGYNSINLQIHNDVNSGGYNAGETKNRERR